MIRSTAATRCFYWGFYRLPLRTVDAIVPQNYHSPSCTAYQVKILTACNLRVSPETAPPSF